MNGWILLLSTLSLIRLQDSGLPYILCTNESCFPTAVMAQKLNKIGFNVPGDKILSPITAIIEVGKYQVLEVLGSILLPLNHRNHIENE